MASTPDDKPQRATAAQMAARRIKDIRRRPPRPGSAGSLSTSQPSFGPFSAIDPNTVSTTSSALQLSTSNPFTFGQSLSFPGAISTPSQSAPNGPSSFSFGGGGGDGPSAFNFSFGGNSPASNPFATMSTGGFGQAPNGDASAGFKENFFDIPLSGAQTQPQQPLLSGGLFGTQSNQSDVGPFGGLIATSGPSSQGTQAPSPGLFGGITATSGASSQGPKASVFGQPTSFSSTLAPSVFAQAASDTKPSIFGQPSSFGLSQGQNVFGGVSEDSMQTSPDAKSNAKTSTSSLFGNGATSSAGFSTSNITATTSGTGLFGAPTPATAPPSPGLFGSKSVEPSTSAPAASLFGPSTGIESAPLTTTAPGIQPSANATVGPATSSISSNAVSTPFKNPFQAANLSSTSTTQTTNVTGQQQEPLSKAGLQATPSTLVPKALFSKTETAVPASTSGNFAEKPKVDFAQPSFTSNLFTPKPLAAGDNLPSTPSQGNPFASLFAQKPDSAKSRTQTQQPPTTSAPAPGFFSPKPVLSGAKTNQFPTPSGTREASANVTSSKPFSFLSAQPLNADSQLKIAPESATPAVSHNADGFLGNASAVASGTPAKVKPLSDLSPAPMPPGLTGEEKERYEIFWRIRTLNECFKREINRLDSATNSFDPIILFYMRIRETIGVPIGQKYKGNGFTGKQIVDDATNVRPTFKIPATGHNSTVGAPTTRASPLGQHVETADSATPDSAAVPTSSSGTSSKRRREDDVKTNFTSPLKKRSHAGEDSTTANIFAKSFSNTATNLEPASPGKLTPVKPAILRTSQSTISPAIPAFSLAPESSVEKPISSSIFTSASVSKPTFGNFSDSLSNQSSSKAFNTSTSSVLSVAPKFGAGVSGDFLSQFKKQADQNAEKEKKQRKAEEFDSEEEDETEWERKDAQRQQKKRAEVEAAANNHAKFVPGKGFVFDNQPESQQKPEKPTLTNGAVDSVFDLKNQSALKSKNIFGHLSASPSEVDADEDEEDDAEDGGENDESNAPTSEDRSNHDGTSEAESRLFSGNAGSFGHESSDDASISGALAKESAKYSMSSAFANGTSASIAAQTPSEGRSLFDRIQYDEAGKPKRREDTTDEKSLSSILGSSKFASSFNTPGSTSPNPFTISRPASAQDNPSSSNTGSHNIFGSSMSSTAGIFSSPAIPATGSSVVSTGSSTKVNADNTWKVNSPIKFANSSSAPTPAPKVDSDSPASFSGPAKPFSTLFGGQTQSTGTKAAAPTTQQSLLGFSFGGPSQQAPSLLAPSTVTSANPSRSTTPGIASDTGAEDSVDGDATEPLPQLDLARSGAGEEDEDAQLETRARALKFKPGDGWQSQGVGVLRILKNRNTSRSRVLLRAEPSGNVILNANLVKEITYKVSGSAVQFFVPQAEGKPEQWALRVKKEEVERLATAMEEHRR